MTNGGAPQDRKHTNAVNIATHRAIRLAKYVVQVGEFEGGSEVDQTAIEVLLELPLEPPPPGPSPLPTP